ncbi:MAG: hypothetical protein KAS11_00825 [Candidatus Aenigmarchaeota archaeon]|nr:hypothetical protein [Candidatus Aenigmarchaeota archaeon]
MSKDSFTRLKDLFTESENESIFEKGYLNIDDMLALCLKNSKLNELIVLLNENNHNDVYNKCQMQLSSPDSLSKKTESSNSGYAKIKKESSNEYRMLSRIELTKELQDKIIEICTNNLLSPNIYHFTEVEIENMFEVDGKGYMFNEKLQKFNGKCLRTIEIPKILTKRKLRKPNNNELDIKDAFLKKAEELGYEIKTSKNRKGYTYFFKAQKIDNCNEMMSIFHQDNTIDIKETIKGTDNWIDQVTMLKYSGNVLVCFYNIKNERYYEDNSVKSSYRNMLQFNGDEFLSPKKRLWDMIKT